MIDALRTIARRLTRRSAGRPLYLDQYPSFGDFDQACLRDVLATLDAAEPVIVEVGSWFGTGSTQIFLEFVKQRGGRLHCVDTWAGSPGVARHTEMLSAYDVYGSFRENVRRAGGEGVVEAHRMPSTEAVAQFADHSIDLVFIDADHTFDNVRADLLAWSPKVRKGGMVCGHDCESRVTDGNRDQLMLARDLDHMQGQPPFPVWHAGVIIAVDEVFKGRATLCAEKPVTLPDGRRGPGTVWYVCV